MTYTIWINGVLVGHDLPTIPHARRAAQVSALAYLQDWQRNCQFDAEYAPERLAYEIRWVEVVANRPRPRKLREYVNAPLRGVGAAYANNPGIKAFVQGALRSTAPKPSAPIPTLIKKNRPPSHGPNNVLDQIERGILTAQECAPKKSPMPQPKPDMEQLPLIGDCNLPINRKF
jgi:hypothetical protein